MKLKQGASYDGEWKDDMMHGKGTLIDGDGSKYVGQFFENAMHGKGIMY